MFMSVYKKPLDLLRDQMSKQKTDIFIIPNTDPHLSEYIPEHWKIIRWLTGFTGSAATVVVTEKFAGLWTDSRYHLQAEAELSGSGVCLMNPGRSAGDYTDWIGENCKQGETAVLDGRIFQLAKYRKLEKILKGKGIRINLRKDLVSPVWDNRPDLPFSEAFEHELRFCGISREEKIARVRDMMKRSGINYNLLTSPDEIMWLLNIRGGDIDFSPVLLSFALVGEDQLILFIDERKIPFKLAASFDKSDVVILPYDGIAEVLSDLSPDSVLLLSPLLTSVSIFNSIARHVVIKEGLSFPARLKAVKNKTEIEGIERVMLRDGTALIRFLHWFESNAGTKMTEMSLAAKLGEFRSRAENYLGPSFATIAAFNDHSALPHYVPSAGTDYEIKGNGIILIDSGGQYKDGTTDITRTIAVGRPSEKQKKDFTLVLKGMIALSTAKFPVFTRGIQLDILARQPLWKEGLNYGHGTGHGIGYCLNVHEGPVSISSGSNPDSANGIEPGMLFSNEPAVYHEGEYGIRTENMILSYEDEESESGRFLRFETLSLCHIEKKLIDKSLLHENEIKWLDDYHSEVYSKLSPFLEQEEKLWLQEKCETL